MTMTVPWKPERDHARCLIIWMFLHTWYNRSIALKGLLQDPEQTQVYYITLGDLGYFLISSPSVFLYFFTRYILTQVNSKLILLT